LALRKRRERTDVNQELASRRKIAGKRVRVALIRGTTGRLMRWTSARVECVSGMTTKPKWPKTDDDPWRGAKREQIGDETASPLPEMDYSVQQPAGDDNPANAGADPGAN
jgi:hypothetical protein